MLSKVTSSDQLTHISQLIDSGQSVLNDIEAVQPQFSRQFTDASAALAGLNVAFDGAVPSLQSTIDIAPLLLANLRTESAQLAALGSTVTTAENKNPAICAYDPSNPGAAGNAHSFVDAYIPRSITPCSPLWTLIAGLVPGPTTSGGALENTGSTQNPIFRICLSLPSSPPSSCQNSGASQQTAFGGSAGTSDAAFFAAFVGA